jgi:predicted nucleic acid-binding protein
LRKRQAVFSPTVTEATARIHSWTERLNARVLYPGPRHLDAVCALLKAAGTAGNLVGDAQIAALALEYGATIHSADTDFARFPDLRWTNPLHR